MFSFQDELGDLNGADFMQLTQLTTLTEIYIKEPQMEVEVVRALCTRLPRLRVFECADYWFKSLDKREGITAQFPHIKFPCAEGD